MAGPFKFCLDNQFFSRTGFITVAPKAAFKINVPLRRLLRSVRLHIRIVELLRIFDLTVIEGILQLPKILPGIFYGAKSRLIRDLRQHRLLVFRSWIFTQERLEMLPIPLPRLLQSRAFSTGQEQPQEIREVRCQRMHIMRSQVHGADREDHFAKSPDKTIMDAVYSGPPYDPSSSGRAEIGKAIRPFLDLQWRKVNSRFLKRLVCNMPQLYNLLLKCLFQDCVCGFSRHGTLVQYPKRACGQSNNPILKVSVR